MIRRKEFEFYENLETLFSVVPGTIGKYMRQLFYLFFLKECCKNLHTDLRIKIQVPKNIVIGNNVGFDYGVWIASNYNINGIITIGDNVLIGPYSIIHSGNHN